MNGKKLFIIALLSVFFIMSCTSCSSPDEATLTIDGKSVKVPYVLKVDGEKVSLNEYRYYFLNLKKAYDSGDESVWEKENTLKMLKLDVLQALKESYAVWNLAEKNDVKLNDEDKEKVKKNIEGQISSYGGEEEYIKALNESYMNEEFYQFIWETSLLYEKLNDFYFGKEGQFYNSDITISHDEEYAEKLKEILEDEMNQLKIEYGPEYDKITTETLL